MIYALCDGGFVISAYDVWLPGVYDTRQAAQFAFRFSYRELKEIADLKRPKSITTKDLKAFKAIKHSRVMKDIMDRRHQ